jgi:hypothetical protein
VTVIEQNPSKLYRGNVNSEREFSWHLIVNSQSSKRQLGLAPDQELLPQVSAPA